MGFRDVKDRLLLRGADRRPLFGVMPGLKESSREAWRGIDSPLVDVNLGINISLSATPIDGREVRCSPETQSRFARGSGAARTNAGGIRASFGSRPSVHVASLRELVSGDVIRPPACVPCGPRFGSPSGYRCSSTESVEGRSCCGGPRNDLEEPPTDELLSVFVASQKRSVISEETAS
jgi:hypothetical protein